jgi:CheY-like chemotaxis protein/HPt (histidine-containing phosphotransfer) domain-containing protein/anti-sigma regulatory factor (Ser/Thr protein kinase)
VLGDPGRLRQALVNLTSNAIKFSSGLARPARVCVRALLIASTAEQVTLEIHVIDNGIGIDAPTRERLFTAFTQADVSTTRNFGGTGLGLAITRQLIELMGGQISVTSEPGQGSLFRVQLAFALPEKSPQAKPSASDVADLSCLVLADEPGLAEDLACYLAHDKFQVELVQSLPAAQHWIAHQPAGQCVVVIDGRDAKSTLQSLRAVANDQAGVELRFVVIGRGRRRRPRLELPDLVSVDANVLTHETLQDSVAIALGRAKALDGRDLIVADSVAPASLSREATRRQGRLILVAEDNPMNQKVILQQLSLLGRTADIASTGVEAFQRWQSGDYDLLFADLHMPQMDGYELTAAVRAAEAGKTRIPIIAFTANALKGEADHCLAVGMDDYLSKPVQLANLKAMLEKWQSVISSEPLVSPAHSARATAYGAADLATPAVDVRVLRSLIGGDAMLSREFLHDFRLTAANIAVELRDCCNAGNALAAGSAAHKLKSSCASVGALALRELCVALEIAGKRGDMPGLSRLLPGFEHELARVNDFVQLY